MTIAGSCLCGGVRYEAEEPVSRVARCHCRQCRKASGAEFATNGSVERARFRVVAGDELLRRFESSAGVFRVFCGRCGSPLFKENASDPGHVRLRLGCVDTEISVVPSEHIWVDDKPRWSKITDGLPEHARGSG
jgi:hypothetical protein